MEKLENAVAAKLAEKIKARVLPNAFTVRIIEQKNWHGLADKQEIQST